jgi:hypothetical protein
LGEGEDTDGGEAGGRSPSPAVEGDVRRFRMATRSIARTHNRDEDWLRHEVVRRATEGRTESSADLYGSDMSAVWAKLEAAEMQFQREGTR